MLDKAPAIPKTKVWIPCVVKSEDALRLLHAQNPNTPTRGWRVLHVYKPMEEVQRYILQINKDAKDLLHPENGKISRGMCIIFLHLRKKSARDDNEYTLETREVEEGPGLVLADLRIVKSNSIDGFAMTATTEEAWDGHPKSDEGPPDKSAT